MGRDKVKARLLKGMQDGMPELARARREMLAKIEAVCRRFGFLPLDTPVLEAQDVLLGPDASAEAQAGIFTFENQDDEEVGLRYDLTVPLARVFSQYRQELAQPFRRYQVGTVYRWDKPGPGRFREFLQFDIDTVGSSSLVADAEVLAVIAQILTELGVANYKIRFSSRKLLNGVGEWCGAGAEQGRDIYRVIDKLDKFDRARIRLELGPGLIDQSGDKIAGLGLSDEQISRIDQFLDLPNAGDAAESLAAARTLLAGNATAEAGLNEIAELIGYLDAFGLPRTDWLLDLHLARGLGYYSGPVFEVTLDDLPQYGSVFGGGRYDGLVDRFLGEGNGVPAVGASVGVDRLLAALAELERQRAKAAGEPDAPPRRATADVLVTVMDKARIADYIAMVRELREAGINAEMWLGGAGSFGKQMKYADKLGIPLAVIAGEDEFSGGAVTVKNLRAGIVLAAFAESREEWLGQRQQVVFPRSKLVKGIRLMLDKSKPFFGDFQISEEFLLGMASSLIEGQEVSAQMLKELLDERIPVIEEVLPRIRIERDKLLRAVPPSPTSLGEVERFLHDVENQLERYQGMKDLIEDKEQSGASLPPMQDLITELLGMTEET